MTRQQWLWWALLTAAWTVIAWSVRAVIDSLTLYGGPRLIALSLALLFMWGAARLVFRRVDRTYR